MEKLKIYMETTMFNYYFDEDRGNAHRYTIKLFEMIKKGIFEAYTSTYVTDELVSAQKEKRDKMLELIDEYGITILRGNDEVKRLGDMYIDEGIIPVGYHTDALHIATATVYDMDTIASMNLRHIVKPKTIEMTGYINIENGYSTVKIRSPEEVVKDVKDRR